MHLASKRLRLVVLSAIAAGALMALTASVASASPVPARWVNPGTAKMSGSLTLKLNGANPKVCSLVGEEGSAVNYGSEGFLSIGASGYVIFGCGTGNLWFATGALASYDSKNILTFFEHSGWASPYGVWNQSTTALPYTNGSGATASKATFSETVIGKTGSGTITATGSLSFTVAGSALLMTH